MSERRREVGPAAAATALFLAALLAAAQGCATAPPAEVPVEALFDGATLRGWDGDERFWVVEGGAIVGRTSAQAPLDRNTFLIWNGPPVGDFELTAEVRLRGDNNSGIQYRATRGEGFATSGYQCDIHPSPEFTAMLYEEGGRGIVATQGSRIRIEPAGTKTPLAAPHAPVEVDLAEWHEFAVIARGRRLEHRLDGMLVVVVEDHEAGKGADAGIIALQLHAGAAYEVAFREIRLVRFD